LNFYISYFDKLSPVILIHSPPHKTVWALPPRYLAGAFPKHINSQDVDTNALFLWEAAQQGDNQRRFLYYYRIIEYSSSFYLDSTTRAALRIALAQPNALDDLSAVTDSVVSAVQKMKMDEPARFEAMLREIINPASLWREMNQNLTAFTTETEFEGGYKVAPLFAIGRTEANFTTQDVGIFAYALRNLRNALSHGRDPRTATTITPTTHNFARLQPWVSISRFAASQVILYKGIF
jgi:hypothetical protein